MGSVVHWGRPGEDAAMWGPAAVVIGSPNGWENDIC